MMSESLMVVQERKLVHSDIKPENLPRTYQTCPGSRPSCPGIRIKVLFTDPGER